MKNLQALFIILILSALIISCGKDRETEKLPRETYTIETGGTQLKSSPNAGGNMIAMIPFGEKLTLTEMSESDASRGTKWYKTKWNDKTGWIMGTSSGEKSSLTPIIKEALNGLKANLAGTKAASLDPSRLTVESVYSYGGGEMEPARMFFLSEGIMFLNSKVFTENYSNTFFEYEFLNEGKLLKIKFIDSSLNFDEYSDIENSSNSIFKIDKNERSITYRINNNGFFFLGWGFYRE